MTMEEFKFRECKRYHSTEHFGETILGIILDDLEYNALLYSTDSLCDVDILSYFSAIGKSNKIRLNITLYIKEKITRYYTIIPPNLVDDIIRSENIGFSHANDSRNVSGGDFRIIIEVELPRESLDKLKEFFIMELGI